MKQDLYTLKNSDYKKNNNTWHVEDSPWKARQIFKILQRNKLSPGTIAEIGCGAGEILVQLNNLINLSKIRYEGYDISPDAFELSKTREQENIKFFNEDLLKKEDVFFD